MRTTVTLDDSLVETAKKYLKTDKVSELVETCLREMVSREAARRLAALGGSDPEASVAPRRNYRAAEIAAEDPELYKTASGK